ncbi:MAG: ferredoxin III, nif-specific [Magnetococcales bacterium]|nr:ferredoxin III, nif-specific [Magnetococcales bacterium]
MAHVTGLTRAGSSWTPHFIVKLDYRKCIGCGRCFKVCSRDVFSLVSRDELEVDDALNDEELDDDGFDDDVLYVMTISNPDDCIGCVSCAKVCPKNCQEHAPLEVAA